jgi:hypothetical protein
MTAFIYFGEMLVASLIAIVLLAISPFRMSSDAALLVAGFVTWTLAEYVVHRFVLHGLVPTQHALHHANPDAAVLNIVWQIWACFALIYLTAGGAFLAGGLVAYGTYSCIIAHITVTISCRYPCLSITEDIINSRRETTASAQRCGIAHSGRCCANDPRKRWWSQLVDATLYLEGEMECA